MGGEKQDNVMIVNLTSANMRVWYHFTGAENYLTLVQYAFLKLIAVSAFFSISLSYLFLHRMPIIFLSFLHRYLHLGCSVLFDI